MTENLNYPSIFHEVKKKKMIHSYLNEEPLGPSSYHGKYEV